LAGLFAFRKLAPRIGEFLNARFNPYRPSAGAPSDESANARAEEQAFSQFVAAFQAGPGVAPHRSPSDPLPSGLHSPMETNANGSSEPLQTFFSAAPERLVMLRQGLSGISRTSEEARQKLLRTLSLQVGALKGTAATFELLPA